MDNTAVLPSDFKIDKRIYTSRGVQVMIDRDLAMLYGVETRAINQSEKEILIGFPSNFVSNYQMMSLIIGYHNL